MAVITYGDVEVEVEGARWWGGDVWLPLAAVPSAIGWEVRPEGVCAGEVCVPQPPGERWWDGEARRVGTTEITENTERAECGERAGS